MLGCILATDAGSLTVGGLQVRWRESLLPYYRRRFFGYVAQRSTLLASLNVAENVGIPLKIAGARVSELRARVADCLQAVEQFEQFVRTGQPLDVHEHLPPEMWSVYRRGMKSVARLSAGEVARRMPLPPQATAMLDIGGAHGLYSVATCRRNPQLTATVLDLPAAREPSADLLAEENMGRRVVHWPGDVLKEDSGSEKWDLIFISQPVSIPKSRSNCAPSREPVSKQE